LERENAQPKKLNFEQWKESDYQEINTFGVHHWQRMNISVPDEKFESSQIKVFFHAQNRQRRFKPQFLRLGSLLHPTDTEWNFGWPGNSQTKQTFLVNQMLSLCWKLLHWKMHLTGHSYHFHLLP
jgi:hypothetical protein